MEVMGMEFAVCGVTKAYGDLVVLDGITFEVPVHGIVAVLGPSGCGKTTLLSIMAGLIEPDRGALSGLEGKGVSYLFQEPRLLDWLTVEGNMGFVLKDAVPKEEIPGLVRFWLEKLGLSAHARSYPRHLSGGQRQRAAMARAMAYPSEVLLMDEPFKSLDLGLKLDLIRDFTRIWTESPKTVVYVTHDVREAAILADTVYVMSDKPTRIRDICSIDIPRAERTLDSPGLLKAEHELTMRLLRRDPLKARI